MRRAIAAIVLFAPMFGDEERHDLTPSGFEWRAGVIVRAI